MRVWLVLGVLGLGCAHTVSENDIANAKMHHDLALETMNRGDLRGALRELLTAVELDPQLAQARNALGLVYHSMGMVDEAIEQYELAIEYKRGYSEAYNNLGGALMDAGRYDDAIASFKVALSDILYPTPSLAEGNMGWAYYQKHDLETAQKHIRNAVATAPQFCRGYEWLARIGLDEGNATQVISSYKRFQKYCLDDAQLSRNISPTFLRQMQYYLAMGYIKSGDAESAKRTLNECATPASDDTYSQKCAQTLLSLQ